jgi:alkanesulfonate monooxygenase SsuD/methylene tetrahydromethanopterin reductase-like flavin-dependent oxidoreductase (luciferase family)
MVFRIGFNTDQHLPWGSLLERWLLLEELGFDSVWVADHLMPWWTDDYHRAHQQVPWDDGTSGTDTDFLEGWTLLAALLARTRTIQGGILVSNNLFRHPALVAKMAATLDQVSGGRFALGMGAGWFEDEHTVYGFDFPRPGTRVDRFAEALEIIEGMLTQERTTFTGSYYHLTNAPSAPRPASRLPIAVGANGPRMLRLTARYADIWSAEGTPEEVTERGRLLDDACRAIGRDPREIRWSHYAYNSILGGNPFASVDAFRRIVTPYRAAGISEAIYELPDEFDERVLATIAQELLPEWNRDD